MIWIGFAVFVTAGILGNGAGVTVGLAGMTYACLKG